jgi:carbon-monoxide dehydrogenase medium subunit
MVCLDAEIVLCSSDGIRSVLASNFFQGIYDTDRQPNELILRVEIPIPDASWRFTFHEISRRHGDFAMAGLVFGMRCLEGAVTDCRAVFMGIESFPRRIAEVESAIVGTKLSSTDAIDQAVALLSTALECEDGEEYPAAYRLYLAKQLFSHCAVKAFSEFTHG